MTDKPIIFSAPMIRAILEGRKTQTRRVIKPQPYNSDGDFVDISIASAARYCRGADGRMYFAFDHPRGGPLTAYVARINAGDRLWVRETWRAHGWYGDCVEIAYKAQQGVVGWAEQHEQIKYPAGDKNAFKYYAPKGPDFWRSSSHMPRWASRLTLEVSDVRVERLQDISEEDARAEGFPITWDGKPYDPPPPDVDSWQGYGRASFFLFWSKIHGHGAWEQNPWVAAYTFRVVKANIDQVPA